VGDIQKKLTETEQANKDLEKNISELKKKLSGIHESQKSRKSTVKDKLESSVEKVPAKEIEFEKMDDEIGANPTGSVGSLAAMCPPSPRNPTNV